MGIDLNQYQGEHERGMKMSFQDEMKQIFLRVTAGEVEQREWKTWWNRNR